MDLEKLVEKFEELYIKGDISTLRTYAKSSENNFNVGFNISDQKAAINAYYFLDDFEAIKRIMQKSKENNLPRPRLYAPPNDIENPDIKGVRKLNKIIIEIYGKK